jgi:endonuclease-3
MSLRRTGKIWNRANASRAQIVRRVCESMIAAYGLPRLQNPHNAVDDLVFIILSNKTSPKTSQAIYHNLKKTYSCWEQTLDTPLRDLRRILKPGGLDRVKSKQLRGALGKINLDMGCCDLKVLKSWPEDEAHRYLTSLSGVSDKVAKCIMLYTLGFDVLPVDSHAHRVASRLGWTARKRSDQCHEELEALIKPKFRFGFHVGCIIHGRTVCRPNHPLCDNCVLRKYCSSRLNRDAKTT